MVTDLNVNNFRPVSYTLMFVYLNHVRNVLSLRMESDLRIQRRISRVSCFSLLRFEVYGLGFACSSCNISNIHINSGVLEKNYGER